jgi:hypothetical protein
MTEHNDRDWNDFEASFRCALEDEARDQSMTDAEFDEWLRQVIEYVFGDSYGPE